MFVVRAIYPLGGHTVTVEGRSRFSNRQEAETIAEELTAREKKSHVNLVGLGAYQATVYIVVEEK